MPSTIQGPTRKPNGWLCKVQDSWAMVGPATQDHDHPHQPQVKGTLHVCVCVRVCVCGLATCPSAPGEVCECGSRGLLNPVSTKPQNNLVFKATRFGSRLEEKTTVVTLPLGCPEDLQRRTGNAGPLQRADVFFHIPPMQNHVRKGRSNPNRQWSRLKG